MPEPAGLLPDDLVEVQRAGRQQHRDHDEQHRDLVGDVLGDHAGGGDDGILVARRPAAEHEGHDVDRTQGENQQQSHVDVAGDEVFAERNHREADQRRRHHHQRRQPVQQAVRAGWHHDLLDEEFDAISHGLEPAAVAGLVGAGAALDAPGDFALGEHQVGGVGADEGADTDEVQQDPDGLEGKESHGRTRAQRSMSGITRSRLPIMARASGRIMPLLASS